MAGRKKLSPAEPGTDIQIADKTPPAIAAQEILARNAGELSSLEQIDGWISVAIQAGQVRAALVAATVSDRIIAESYVKAVGTKTYIDLPYTDADGARKRVSSLDEFCTVFFGKGARRCRQIAENLETLGQELFEAAGKIGLGQRDYVALKALPADDQDAIKQAIAGGDDRGAVVGMLAQLAERQAAEKADLQANLEASRKLVGDGAAKAERLQKQLHQAKLQRERATPEETLSLLRERTTAAALQVRVDITALGEGVDSLRERFAELREHAITTDANDVGDGQDAYMAGVIGELMGELRRLRDDFGLPIVNDRGANGWQGE